MNAHLRGLCCQALLAFGLAPGVALALFTEGATSPRTPKEARPI
jgi:hypothetical protein